MTIITQDYALTTNESFPLDKRRWAMSQYVFNMKVAFDKNNLFGPCKELGWLSLETLFPEHNESSSPLLLADQLRNGISLESLRKEDKLRRIYQLGRASLCVRCIPDYEQGLDELQFLFRGVHNRDIKPAVNAIEGMINRPSFKEVLEFTKNN